MVTVLHSCQDQSPVSTSPHANNVSIRSVLSGRPLGEAAAHNMTGQFWPITGGGLLQAAGCTLAGYGRSAAVNISQISANDC